MARQHKGRVKYNFIKESLGLFPFPLGELTAQPENSGLPVHKVSDPIMGLNSNYIKLSVFV